MGDTPHASAWTVCPSTWYPPLGVEVLHQHCGTGCDWCAEVAYTRLEIFTRCGGSSSSRFATQILIFDLWFEDAQVDLGKTAAADE